MANPSTIAKAIAGKAFIAFDPAVFFVTSAMSLHIINKHIKVTFDVSSINFNKKSFNWMDE